MGLVKTITSPLTNTTSLVSIILIIILIAVFRWDGGKLTSESAKNKDIVGSIDFSKKKKVKLNNLEKSTGTIEINANEFDELMKRRKPAKKVEQKKAEKENSFDSIEADLGLR